MTATNFDAALSFVWQDQYDSPSQGYHTTSGDTGGGTYGGVIESTWAAAVSRGMVSGLLRNATQPQLSLVLRNDFWGASCDHLPSGLDLMLFNGRMMTGYYGKLFQQVIGFIGDDVDGFVGSQTLAQAAIMHPATIVQALTGSHYAYLSGLSNWREFEGGWTHRLVDVRTTALSLIGSASSAATVIAETVTVGGKAAT